MAAVTPLVLAGTGRARRALLDLLSIGGPGTAELPTQEHAQEGEANCPTRQVH